MKEPTGNTIFSISKRSARCIPCVTSETDKVLALLKNTSNVQTFLSETLTYAFLKPQIEKNQIKSLEASKAAIQRNDANNAIYDANNEAIVAADAATEAEQAAQEATAAAEGDYESY